MWIYTHACTRVELVGAKEYTDCISVEEWDPHVYHGYDSKQFDGGSPVPEFTITSRSTITKVVVLDRVLSIQIELFDI